mmetsp:Transcript_39689/g.85609  ORF Transcript_39689/g.85609 Transcript_39689/m.85609 type:complete len:490 (-) Transcript_39689:71-1540(-)
MVFRVESADFLTKLALMASSHGSLVSSDVDDDDDIEGGHSSQEDNDKHRIHSHSKKFVTSEAGVMSRRRRRRAQSEQPSFRQTSLSPTTTPIDSGKRSPTPKRQCPSSSQAQVPLLESPSSGRWSTLTTLDNIQFCPPATKPQHYQNNSSFFSSSSFAAHGHKKYHPLALLTIVSTLLVGCMIRQQMELSSLRQELLITNQHRLHMEQTRSSLLTQLDDREKSLDQYHYTHEQMKKVKADMSERMRRLRVDYDSSVEELERLHVVKKRLDWSESRWEEYVGRIRNVSKRSVVAKYGKGPHHVELQVQFPSSSSPETIKIELAPLDIMPHSIHTFLEQIDEGMWDGASFDVANAGHVLMAAAHDQAPSATPSLTTTTTSMKTTTLFPEYHAHYSHDKYTIAFPSSQSSSSQQQSGFYINLQPNTIHHSPRIEGEKYIEGESCFGRIVDEMSRNVVDRMDGSNRLSTNGRDNRGEILEEGVIIRSARIVGV